MRIIANGEDINFSIQGITKIDCEEPTVCLLMGSDDNHYFSIVVSYSEIASLNGMIAQIQIGESNGH